MLWRGRPRSWALLVATFLSGAGLLVPQVSAASSSSGSSSGIANSLCWRGTSEYEMELVYCNDEDDLDIDITWYCFKSEICQDWKSSNRRCPIVKGCATEDNCTTSNGELVEGEKKSAGALTIQTWCSLAETSDEYSALSLRTPTNGASTGAFWHRWFAGKWTPLSLAVSLAGYAAVGRIFEGQLCDRVSGSPAT